ncbi:MAG: FprA family A-type flavoprotein [Alphaproteobacteria bacterium]|nr:FprA family A-type flavoprotein [Alphaproteobacteria bacterium]
MFDIQLGKDIHYIGVDDKTLDLFEGQYVIPNGISYNSYVISDEKIAVMDTADKRVSKEWFANLRKVLGARLPDYLVILHMEPDHAANVAEFLRAYPTAKVVSNTKSFNLLQQFFNDIDLSGRSIEVKDGDELALGEHILRFVAAPMVHWPEVMFAYDQKAKVLFSADAFGKFGALDCDEDWACEARRYYFNIVGKYGAQVQNVLKKAALMDIQKIFPLHGPMLTENLDYYLGKYNLWSAYQPEDKGVFIAYVSIYGHTESAVLQLKKMLTSAGIKTVASDLAREDMAEALEDAFRYDRLVLACVTHDAGLMPQMENFLLQLRDRNYQNRKVALIENGSWAPIAAKKMREILEPCKNLTFLENKLTIKSALKPADLPQLEALAKELAVV